jgi:hypothetical protein
MRERIVFLERELERKDAILLNMTEAMEAIAPPAQEEAPEPPEAPQTATEQPGRVGLNRLSKALRRAAARRPWWRRMFGA